MGDDPLLGYATDALRFERLLGRGGMGAVYQGVQIGMGRRVAIKVVAPHLAADTAYIQRFAREARTLGRLVHANVIACHDFGPITGPSPGPQPLYVMVLEYVDGWSLARLLERRPLSVRRILDLHRQAAEGLAAAHRLGIVHRDIKPDNLMVTRDGVAKLADFGLARAPDSAQVTQAGTLLGSPAYMSPEACRGEEPGPAGDIYGLGCSLFQCLTGETPFVGASSLQLIHLHVNQEPPGLATRRADLAPLGPLLAACLAKDPRLRPDAATLARQLAACRRQFGRSRAGRRPASPDGPTVLSRAAAPAGAARRRRLGRLLLIAAAASLAIAAAVLAMRPGAPAAAPAAAAEPPPVVLLPWSFDPPPRLRLRLADPARLERVELLWPRPADGASLGSAAQLAAAIDRGLGLAGRTVVVPMADTTWRQALEPDGRVGLRVVYLPTAGAPGGMARLLRHAAALQLRTGCLLAVVAGGERAGGAEAAAWDAALEEIRLGRPAGPSAAAEGVAPPVLDLLRAGPAASPAQRLAAVESGMRALLATWRTALAPRAP